jgi:hypothetical protein
MRNGRFRRNLAVAVRSGEGPLTEHITATQTQPPERVFEVDPENETAG